MFCYIIPTGTKSKKFSRVEKTQFLMLFEGGWNIIDCSELFSGLWTDSVGRRIGSPSDSIAVPCVYEVINVDAEGRDYFELCGCSSARFVYNELILYSKDSETIFWYNSCMTKVKYNGTPYVYNGLPKGDYKTVKCDKNIVLRGLI